MILSSCGEVTRSTTVASPQVFSAPSTSTQTPATTPTLSVPTPDIAESTEVSSLANDLLINVSADYSADCERTEKNQIWYLPADAHEPTVVLADDEIDFNYPVWMPSGDRILYVESIPLDIYADGTTSNTAGTDSLWIVDLDSSNPQRISDYFSRTNHWGRTTNKCFIDTFIVPSPVVSLDGRYVAFTHGTIVREGGYSSWDYYILDMQSGATEFVHTQINYAQPVWEPGTNRLVVVNSLGYEVVIIDVGSPGIIDIQRIHYPPEVADREGTFGIFFADGAGEVYRMPIVDSSVFGSFFFLNNITSYYETLWKLDIDLAEWERVDVGREPGWRDPLLGNTVHVACGGDGKIYFLDPSDWTDLGSYEGNVRRPRFTCNFVQLTMNGRNEEIVSFVIAEEERDGLWIISDFVYPVSAVEYINIGDVDQTYFRILDYSWKPLKSCMIGDRLPKLFVAQ
ncbi:MAG: hypothetical protein DWQ07_07980 [Chloroflexi bacterium]|nr:MAG: hypothetical protein DWQ07_07980 [Chloroflexota bacterium]MBL1197023.1 hypothetical protein [Chloroflexota bacterium]